MEENDPKDGVLPNGRKISDILRSMPDHFSTPDVSIAAIKDALSGRAYGILLLILALPNLLPIPAPGLSAALGIPLVFVTFQLMLGIRTPWIPGFISRHSIKRSQLQHLCLRVTPYIEKLELIVKPRMIFLARPPADRLIALICVVLSLMISMPIPFGNAIPALSLCLFAIGILQRDGLFVLLGAVTTLAGLAAISAFLNALSWSILKFLGAHSP